MEGRRSTAKRRRGFRWADVAYRGSLGPFRPTLEVAVNRSEIEDAVLRTFVEVVPDAESDQLDRSVPLRDQVEMDSLDYLNFVLGLEARLCVQVPPASYTFFATIEGAVDAIEGLLRAASS